jgi:hypothetical protein
MRLQKCQDFRVVPMSTGRFDGFACDCANISLPTLTKPAKSTLLKDFNVSLGHAPATP